MKNSITKLSYPMLSRLKIKDLFNPALYSFIANKIPA